MIIGGAVIGSEDWGEDLCRAFESFHYAIGLKHFAARELLTATDHFKDGVKNSPPPPGLWRNIIETARVLDELRKHLSAPIIITSTYRNESYNKAIGGSPNSRHTRYNALDFYSQHVKPDVLAQTLLSWRAEGRFRGGVGTYPSFVHLDTRGENATW